MPIALSTRQAFDFVFIVDQGEPDPPVFTFRFLSEGELAELLDWRDAADREEDNARARELLYKIVRAPLVGWRNLRGRDGKEIPYDPDALGKVLSLAELWEACWRLPNVMARGEDDVAKKKLEELLRPPPSGSQSESGTASPAAAAPPGSATTPRPSSNPSSSAA